MGAELEPIDSEPRLAEKERRWSLVWTLQNKRVGDNAAIHVLYLEPSKPGPGKCRPRHTH